MTKNSWIFKCKTLKVTLEPMSRPMLFTFNKFYNYSVYCKYMDFLAVGKAKLSIKVLRLIQTAYYYKPLTTENYEE
jgi:hypothetical protein